MADTTTANITNVIQTVLAAQLVSRSLNEAENGVPAVPAVTRRTEVSGAIKNECLTRRSMARALQRLRWS